MKKLYTVILMACLFLMVASPSLHAAVDGVRIQPEQDYQKDESEDESIKKKDLKKNIKKKDLKKKGDTQKKPRNPNTNSE